MKLCSVKNMHDLKNPWPLFPNLCHGKLLDSGYSELAV